MRYMLWALWLASGVLSVLGCATVPTEPEGGGAYAVIELPAVIRVLALDDRQVDHPAGMTTLHVSPGRHRLQFAYAAVGVNASPEHDGQVIDPFFLDVRAGHTYRLVAKT